MLLAETSVYEGVVTDAFALLCGPFCSSPRHSSFMLRMNSASHESNLAARGRNLDFDVANYRGQWRELAFLWGMKSSPRLAGSDSDM